MSIEVKVPALPESVADATILGWHKQPGEAVKRDENLVDLETDKVVLEVPAPADGVMGEILMDVDSVVTSGEVLATLVEGAVAEAAPAAAAAPAEAAPAAEEAAPAGDKPLSPSARRAVAETGVDPSSVAGSGVGGRVTRQDVEAAASSAPAAAAAAAPAPAGARPEQRVAMTRLRKRVAERLIDAQQTAAILTTFNEVNMKPVMDLRKQYKDQFLKAHDTKLGFMSFFVKAAADALKKYPVVNASVDGDDIVYHGFFDIGIAVGSERGLVVPILRDADQMSFAEIEATIADFGARAQKGAIGLDELTGGTFSITNGGIFGSMLSTPILNPPQSAILGMHNIVERPMVENGEIVIRPVMYLALSYDHRIIDGREAVSFLVHIKQRLEEPTKLLLDI